MTDILHGASPEHAFDAVSRRFRPNRARSDCPLANLPGVSRNRRAGYGRSMASGQSYATHSGLRALCPGTVLSVAGTLRGAGLFRRCEGRPIVSQGDGWCARRLKMDRGIAARDLPWRRADVADVDRICAARSPAVHPTGCWPKKRQWTLSSPILSRLWRQVATRGGRSGGTAPDPSRQSRVLVVFRSRRRALCRDSVPPIPPSAPLGHVSAR